MTADELDSRIRALPPAFGIRHFAKGISPLSQISGSERKAMARILLGCLIGRLPAQGIKACRAILDFIYLAQYSTHDDGTLAAMKVALDCWHKNRIYFITAGVRHDFNIPKFHSLLHYIDSIRLFGTTDNYNTEMFERLHIDFAKEGWRASNRRDEFPQMIAWLTRQEKIASFTTYQAWLESSQKAASHAVVRTFTGQAVKLAKTAQSPRQALSQITQNHHAPSFVHSLKEYVNQFGQSLPQAVLRATPLPFSRLDVYHNFKFEPTSLDPGDESGMRVGRVKVIFQLPQTLSSGHSSPAHWPKYPLAYVEWFSSFKPSHENNHEMYAITRPPPLTDGTIRGAVPTQPRFRGSQSL
ncbi:hypothetical protein B0H14DRAFT_3730925 [Mycena olivaceomarginata]|nr:hypothetical protein B0H14DRAFT_3730925 [Mycena olivaceomarginata]